jgi:hypothetical protein
MYVIRRVWATKPREARRVASMVAEIGKIYEESGQREPTRVYFNGGTLPGERDIVYMEWTAQALESPYRGDNVLPDTGGLGAKVRELTEDSWIEFYELLTPDKAIPVE